MAGWGSAWRCRVYCEDSCYELMVMVRDRDPYEPFDFEACVRWCMELEGCPADARDEPE